MSILQTLLYVGQWARLRALCFFVWATFHSSFNAEHPKPDAAALASAIADAAMTDADPVFGDAEHETAVAAEYAVRESWLQKGAVGDHGEAFGVFQLHQAAGRSSLEDQVSAWLKLLHDGAVICPASPAAPLSGGCNSAHKLANRRVKVAFAAVDSFLLKETTDAVVEKAPAATRGGQQAAAVSAGSADPSL